MAYRLLARAGFEGFPQIGGVALLLFTAVTVRAQDQTSQAASALPAPPPTLTVDPPGRTDLAQKSIQVTLTAKGASFANTANLTLQFDPSSMITATPPKQAGSNTATTTLTMASNAWGTVSVTLVADGKSYAGAFTTGVYCLDATAALGGCDLRFEIDTTSASGSSSQTNKSTAPNIMVNLDYLWAKNKDSKTGRGLNISHGAQGFADRLSTHLTLDTGYTQTVAATKLQPVATGSSAPASASSTPCSGTASSSSTSSALTSCTAAAPQQAFVVTAGGTIGWSFSKDGQGTFAEFGLAVRGSFQDLVQSNQIVQSGGVSYLNLSSNNPRNAIGLYEGVFRFRVGAIGHDAPAARNPKSTPASKELVVAPEAATNPANVDLAKSRKVSGSQKSTYAHNTSNFLVMEAGYQNNSGLTQLAADPQARTRNRFVGRFYIYPPLPGATQTKPRFGMEFSGGIDGGPKIVQIFFGLNLNPAKLVQNNKPDPKSATIQ